MGQLAVTYSFNITHPGGGHVYGYLLIFNLCILVSSNVDPVHNCSLFPLPNWSKACQDRDFNSTCCVCTP